MKWHKTLLEMLKKRQDKKIALAIDTSSNEAPKELIENIVTFFKQLKSDSQLVQADFKIRSVNPIQNEEVAIKYYSHGKSSYTEVLEWAEKEEIETLFYITDVTGFFHDEQKIDYEVIWLVPDNFVPKVPFGKALKIA